MTNSPAHSYRYVTEKFGDQGNILGSTRPQRIGEQVARWGHEVASDHDDAHFELGIPFCTQIGHTGPLCPSEPGRPIPYLDDVLLEFPDLVVVGGHVGYPWIDEVISLANKYPTFYVDTSAYAMDCLPSALIEYMRGHAALE